MSNERDLSRRTVLQGTAAAGLATTGAFGFSHREAHAQGAFNWQRFKGEKIEVSLVKSPRGDLLQKHQKEFEDLTGIKVGAEQIPEQQHRQKQVIEFTSGRPSFDVTTTAWHVQKRLFAKGKWLEDLRPMLADASMTAPDIDRSDYLKAGMGYATESDGRISSLPLQIDYFILYYNKELFAAKGLSVPKTFDEMVAAAAKIHDPANGIYGSVNRGLKNANVVTWAALMAGFGAEALDANGKLLTDQPGAIAAAEMYKKLNTQYAPPGVIAFNWMECLAAFSQGKCGMWIDGVGWAPPLEDPAKSKIVGKVGYAVIPAGPAKHEAVVFGDGIGVAAASRKKGPAFFYTQWAPSKTMMRRMVEEGAGSPTRASAFETDKLKLPREWVQSIIDSAKIGRAGLPEIIPVSEYRDTFGIALTNMFSGADPAAELKKATEAFKPILEKSEQA